MKQLAINMLGETVDVFSSWSAQSPSFRVEVSKKIESHIDIDDYFVSNWEPLAKHATT